MDESSRQTPGRSYTDMVDIDLLVEQLRRRGHTVEGVVKVPADAGEYELIVDGEEVNLAEAEEILAEDQA